MLRLKLSSKILIYFLVGSLVPFTIANFIVVTSANSQLLKAASVKQQAISSDLVHRVNDYLENKIDNLVYQSQRYSAGNLNATETNQNLAVLFNQDHDLQRIAILDTNGQNHVVFDKNGIVKTLDDESNTDAFKSVNFLSGKVFVSSVSYDKDHKPLITIAAPVLRSDFSQHLNDLSKANFGTYVDQRDIIGSVVANYNISDLWQTVLSTRIGQGGYAYVVDGLGNLVAHPDEKFLTSHQKLSDITAVNDFINGDFGTHKTTSETGQSVISTPQQTSYSSWAVIVEEPVSSIYSGVNAYIKLATIVGLTSLGLAIFLSIYFRKQLTAPLSKLTLGAKKLGDGEFGHKIDITSGDEFQDLADTFNKMGWDIQTLVNDLKANNVNLTVEQTKLNNIIASVSDGIIALNNKNEIVSINPPAAMLVNREAKDLLNKSMSEFFFWEQNGKQFAPELQKPGLYHYSDLTLLHGKDISYLDLMAVVLDAKVSDVKAILTIHDLTQSRELDFMKLDFVAIAAHELRTPLTAVKGYLDMIKDNVLKHLTIIDIENLQRAVVGTNQLRDLINKLLSIARIERGEMELSPEKIDLARLIKDNVTQHELMASQKEQRVNYTASTDGPVYVPADASSISEVLNNLLGNALKFTGPGGRVKVSLHVQNDMARVEVNDNGPGIPTELRERLFTKFYRAERSLISNTRGTGLGLFISKTIIELQGGEIGLEPDDSKGSTFYFTLPIYDPSKHDKLITKEERSGEIRGWFKKRPSSRR